MEEILASIRRIIAEGEREAQAAPLQESRPAEAEAAKVLTPTSEPFPPPAAEPEILILTQMVQDDGSVVSLQAAPPGAAAEPATEAPSVEVPEFEATPPSSPAPDAIEPVSELARVDISAESAVVPAVEALATFSATTIEADVPTAPVNAHAQQERLELSLTTTPLEEERTAVPAEGPKKPEIVSEEALAASTAALSQLAQSVSRSREPVPGQSKTVEEVVREAVEPMLKQWLDANLPRIVERMVREAIDRVVRRVE